LDDFLGVNQFHLIKEPTIAELKMALKVKMGADFQSNPLLTILCVKYDICVLTRIKAGLHCLVVNFTIAITARN
jgi:hypothetical protein